jgi:hypothetical protein
VHWRDLTGENERARESVCETPRESERE